MKSQLLLNVIPFAPVQSQIEVAFYREDKIGYCRVHKDNLQGLLETHFTAQEIYELGWLFTDFDKPGQDAIVFKVNLVWHEHFAQHYYRHLIRTYFKGVADITRRNFTRDVEVWIHNPDSKSKQYQVYNQYTLKVQHSRLTNGPELVISYDGKSKVYNKSLAELVDFPSENLNWINCNGELQKFKYLEPEQKLQLDKLFPVISNKLKPQLSISSDTPDLSNRYPKYHKALKDFYTRFLNTDSFRQVLNICPSGFLYADSSIVQQISSTSNELQFGRGIATEPKLDMKRLGPCKPPKTNNVRFFFIYQKDQRPNVVKLHDYFTKGFWQEGSSFAAFPDMQAFICQPFLIEPDASITFDSMSTAVATVAKAVKEKTLLPNTRYMAIYLTPESRMTVSQEDRIVYYRIKECLLKNGITSQVIYTSNVANPNFKYFLPNIEIAILAKLGGIPWRLNRNVTNELIVGIGAFYSASAKTRFIGSAFCFNNEGLFQGFDCFRADETYMLAGSIRSAVLKYLVDKPKADRLIIHFYKEISKNELQPIIDTLYKLGLNIPVVIVTINKTESKALLAFDEGSPCLMPYSGTIIKVGQRDYLLFNNTRYNQSSNPTGREYHFPIKISFGGSDRRMFDDKATVERLIDQVYQFSRMYWKSVSQQNLPVTIKYPAMVAEIYPHFLYEKLPEFGKENLWFL